MGCAAAADFRRACRVLEPLDYAEPRYFCGQDGGRSAYEQREEVLLDLAAEVGVRHGVRDLFVRPGSAVGFAAVGLHSADETEAEAAAAAAAAADKKDQEQGPDDVTEEERDDMYMRAALNVFMSNRFSDSLPDSTLLGISDVELYRELLGGAD